MNGDPYSRSLQAQSAPFPGSQNSDRCTLASLSQQQGRQVAQRPIISHVGPEPPPPSSSRFPAVLFVYLPMHDALWIAAGTSASQSAAGRKVQSSG